ncbi:stage III sporulation protein AH [Caldicoprobacter guelmensis]|uniref:SpoIIIAH-like family protein n=1 Tax=Caldicoprobacter guelmensis TaxID=1170224 RepID=UPI00195DE951|nr:SpoIIIAH-like family protein [Caldicoprobacter guelmensis]MBM7581289.1 stage III sporulation protein AH [Caldicoprobacter guelmensis]
MLVLRKKSVVMGILVALLIITGYLNLVYNQSVLNGQDVQEASSQQEKEDGIAVKGQEDSSGEEDATEVAAISSANFFASYRAERENTRKEEIEYIREILDNPASDPDMKKEAQAQLLEITRNMEKEMAIEALIKAKGFRDVVVILHKDSVNVIVDKPELKQEEVAQILDIVRRESGHKPENVKIIPKI